MSGSGSVFRHGTLRWTYAPRSKWPHCLPQCIPNRSDKVPPLCDPDPLLIMDRLQNRPLRGRTGPAHRAAVCAPRSAAACWWTHMIWHVNFHAVWQAQTDREQCEVFLSAVSPFKNVTVTSPRVCVNLILTAYYTFTIHSNHSFMQLCIYYNTGVCRTSKTKNNCQVLASSFQLFDISAEAAMHRIWFPSELFLSLAKKKIPPHICDCSAL